MTYHYSARWGRCHDQCGAHSGLPHLLSTLNFFYKNLKKIEEITKIEKILLAKKLKKIEITKIEENLGMSRDKVGMGCVQKQPYVQHPQAKPAYVSLCDILIYAISKFHSVMRTWSCVQGHAGRLVRSPESAVTSREFQNGV